MTVRWVINHVVTNRSWDDLNLAYIGLVSADEEALSADSDAVIVGARAHGPDTTRRVLPTPTCPM